MRTLFLIGALLVLASCAGTSKTVLKSPCVGADDSPCGPKRPANSWMKQSDTV